MNKETRELDDIELALAKIYSEIDCGDLCGDLTGGLAVQKRIRDMDRKGKSRTTEKYLTYPENAKYFLDNNNDCENNENNNTTMNEEREKLAIALEAMYVETNEKENDDDDATNALALSLEERAMNMPLVTVRTNDKESMYMVKSTKRPPKKIEYEFTIGRLPDRRIPDEELDEGKNDIECYRNLEQIDWFPNIFLFSILCISFY